MVDGTAEKETGTTPEKSPEDIKREEVAAELLKELEAETEEADTKEDDDKGEADEGSGDGETGDGETQDEEDAQGSESQTDSGKPKGKRGFKRRQANLVKQREKARSEKEELAQQLKDSEDEKEILKMKLNKQAGQPQELKKPDPEDFESDDKYLDAKEKYDDQRVERISAKKAQEIVSQSQQTQTIQHANRELERKQEAHWEDADSMEVKDYDDKEKKATDVMGPETITNIIEFFPGDSASLVYYFGANEEDAERIGELLNDKTKMVQGVAEVGRILEKIKVKPLKKKHSPNPDEELEGSEPSAEDALKRRLNQLREEAQKTGSKGGMTKLMEFKRKAKERGIIL